MDPYPFREAKCMICDVKETGRFRDRWFYCARHQRDEVDFHQSLQAGPLSKEQKQLRMIYRRRWDRKEQPQ